jgi:hypothetical protein
MTFLWKMDGKRQLKRLAFIVVASIVVFLLYNVWFLFFTDLGYLCLIGTKGFIKNDSGDSIIYVDEDYETEVTSSYWTSVAFKKSIDEAEERVKAFWDSDITADVVYIVTSDRSKWEIIYGEDITNSLDTVIGLAVTDTGYAPLKKGFFGIRTFIILKPTVDTDTVAHELMHAETKARLYSKSNDKWSYVPMWFHEGMAQQVENNRADRNDAAWAETTFNGTYVTSFSRIETYEDFQSADYYRTSYNYTISRYEIKTWIEKNGKDKLIELVQGVQSGQNFHTLYGAPLTETTE